MGAEQRLFTSFSEQIGQQRPAAGKDIKIIFPVLLTTYKFCAYIGPSSADPAFSRSRCVAIVPYRAFVILVFMLSCDRSHCRLMTDVTVPQFPIQRVGWIPLPTGEVRCPYCTRCCPTANGSQQTHMESRHPLLWTHIKSFVRFVSECLEQLLLSLSDFLQKPGTRRNPKTERATMLAFLQEELRRGQGQFLSSQPRIIWTIAASSPA